MQQPISFLEGEFILSLGGFLFYILFLMKNVITEKVNFYIFQYINQIRKVSLTFFPMAFFASLLATGELI